MAQHRRVAAPAIEKWALWFLEHLQGTVLLLDLRAGQGRAVNGERGKGRNRARGGLPLMGKTTDEGVGADSRTLLRWGA
jgi:hypothetical protein